MTNDWIENTGSVPEGVGPDTPIEVKYRDGGFDTWGSNSKVVANNHPTFWKHQGDPDDIIRWRFVKEET